MGIILPKGYAITFECSNLNEMSDLFISKNGNGTTVFEVHAFYFSVKNFVFPLEDSVLAICCSLLHYWFRHVLSIANQKNLQNICILEQANTFLMLLTPEKSYRVLVLTQSESTTI